MAAADCFVSVVAPLGSDSAIVEAFVAEVMGVLRDNYANYELVLVDDGSGDDTALKVAALLNAYECIRLIRLSRRFSLEVAIAAGLDSAIGDYVVVMLPNSDPPRLIPDMIRDSRSRHGIVFGVRADRSDQPPLTRAAIGLFYWCAKRFLKLAIPENATYFLVMNRQAVNAITRIKDKHRHLRVLSAYVGYDSKSFVYQPINRHGGSSRRSFFEVVNVAIDIIVANSIHPLRLVSWLGLFAGTVNAAYVCYILGIYLFKPDVAPGWTTLSLQTAGMFFLVFLVLTILSEYVGHILDELRDRPLYYILEEKNSSVLIPDQERRNVVRDSLPTDLVQVKSKN